MGTVDDRRIAKSFTSAVALAAAGAVALVACTSSPGSGANSTSGTNGGSGTRSSSSSSTPAGGGGSSSAPQVEVHPPGDIPDNQQFVAYAGQGFTVSVPEGWGRTTTSTGVRFTDK